MTNIDALPGVLDSLLPSLSLSCQSPRVLFEQRKRQGVREGERNVCLLLIIRQRQAEKGMSTERVSESSLMVPF